ncbi:MAG: type II toxin-antitoxin system VapB family antitoxin [Sphingomicrobium sp.]
MRTTINLDDELISKAAEYTGVKERSALVRMGLESLIAREAQRRLAALKGSIPNLGSTPVPRRRPPDFINPE